MQKIVLLITLVICFNANSQRNWDKPMQLKSCTIQIKADPFTASSFIELEFFNPNDQEIEGLYSFQLNPGQAITAFQLDLNGKYRDGSIEEKWKARNAYNTIVGKRIDPALLQMDSYNRYSLRIYPIAAKSSRRITMTVQQLLQQTKDRLEFQLPLSFSNPAERFNISIDVNNTYTHPFITNGLLAHQYFNHRSSNHQLNYGAENIMLNQPIAFAIPILKGDVVCVQRNKGQSDFAITHFSSVLPDYAIEAKTLSVYWDVSASGKNRDMNKELNFLKQYIAYHKIDQLTIHPFNYKLQQSRTFIHPSDNQWQSFLNEQEYDGATQLGCINLSKESADVVLLFSDGINSYGNNTVKGGNGYLFSVHSSASFDQQQLLRITAITGGADIDLQRLAASDAIRMASKAQNTLTDVRSASGKTIINTVWQGNDGASTVTGVLQGYTDTIYFVYGNSNRKEAVEKVVVSDAMSCSVSAIEKLQALHDFDDLIKSNQWQQILLFGKTNRIVTPNTSYIVLERVEDYVRFGIEPPKELEEQCAQQGFITKATKERLQQQSSLEQYNRIANVVAQYNERIRKLSDHKELIQINAQQFLQQNSYAANKSFPAEDGNKDLSFFEGEGRLEEIVVTSASLSRRKQMMGYSVSTVEGSQLSQTAGTIEQALQGKVAGLQIVQAPSAQIVIRGASSLRGSNSPLYVIDGLPFDGDINSLVNVQDIAYISVLKDAAATSLYGSRGSNGVIVIVTKKGSINRNDDYYRPYKLNNLPDVDYLQELKETAKKEKIEKYRQLRMAHSNDPSFFLDIAQHFFESDLKAEALQVLTNAAEAASGNLLVLRSIAFTLEQWKSFDEAINVYKQIKQLSSNDVVAYRDLALALYQNGAYQQAIDLLYEGINKDFGVMEYQNSSIKAMLLNDLNAIVAMHKDGVNIAEINKELLKPIAGDLRIVVESNGVYGDLSLVEPNGEKVTSYQYNYKSKAFFQKAHNVSEYMLTNASKGKYTIQVQYNDYYRGKLPAFFKIVTYRNFGKVNQTMSIENVMLDNQNGIVEIATVKM